MLKNLLFDFIKFFSISRTTNQRENITSVVFRMIKSYRIKVTHTTIIEYIKSHPDYPTLKSICDFFNYINVAIYPLKLDKSELYDIPIPFIALIKEKCGKVILVYSINKKRVIYTDSIKGKRIMSLDEFMEKWEGVVIAIEPDNLSGEVNYQVIRSNEIVRKLLMPLTFMTISIICLYSTFGREFSEEGYSIVPIIISTHIIGLFLSLLLFNQELGRKMEFTEKICHISNYTDCEVVAKSKGSKLIGNITWADIGIVYFSGGLISLFIFPTENIVSLIRVLSICSLPYPFFSIYYQWLKLRKWCPLCLLVQTVLLTEFVILMIITKPLDLNISILVSFLVINSIILVLTLQTKFIIINERERDNFKIELMKVKRDQEIFIQKMKNTKKINFPEENKTLIFGDLKSKVMITVFLSLNCSHCSNRFNEIMNLIRGKTKVKVQLVFSQFMDELSLNFLKVVIKKFFSNESKKAVELLESWYKTERNARNRLLNDPNELKSSEEFNDVMNYSNRLFKIANITRIPVVLVNGMQLPEFYTIEEMRYHMNVLEKMNEENIYIGT